MSEVIDLILKGTPDMIIECVTNLAKKLNSQGERYKSVPKIGGAPDYAKQDKIYSANIDVFVSRKPLAREDYDIKIGVLRLQLIPDEHTLLSVKEPEYWDSPLGHFLNYLLGELQRLGFVQFEEEKPPIGFRPHYNKQ